MSQAVLAARLENIKSDINQQQLFGSCPKVKSAAGWSKDEANTAQLGKHNRWPSNIDILSMNHNCKSEYSSEQVIFFSQFYSLKVKH
jgi:hypothetical protein